MQGSAIDLLVPGGRAAQAGVKVHHRLVAETFVREGDVGQGVTNIPGTLLFVFCLSFISRELF